MITNIQKIDYFGNDVVLRQITDTINEVYRLLRERKSVYVVNLPDEAIPKIKQEKISPSEKLSRLKRTYSSLHELEELSCGGLVDLVV